MIRSASSLVFTVLVAATSLLAAQQPQVPSPSKEQQWLQQFVGQWDMESEGSAGTDQPSMTYRGKMTGRMLGDFWIINEMEIDLPGANMKGIQTIGYDTEQKQYIGTWVDSMMNHMWRYEGSVDETGKILTLEAEGPNFENAGKMTKFRDAYQFKSADEVLATSSMLDADGKWIVFMTGKLTRR